MYLALTYDHRLLDGKDAVLFLKRIQQHIQDPRRMLFGI
jgi:2-oxoglutarate dehydrogenase E2 component (dihydrolipoamide succinyltransferase)